MDDATAHRRLARIIALLWTVIGLLTFAGAAVTVLVGTVIVSYRDGQENLARALAESKANQDKRALELGIRNERVEGKIDMLLGLFDGWQKPLTTKSAGPGP